VSIHVPLMVHIVMRDVGGGEKVYRAGRGDMWKGRGERRGEGRDVEGGGMRRRGERKEG
jgi:hypothetical protein